MKHLSLIISAIAMLLLPASCGSNDHADDALQQASTKKERNFIAEGNDDYRDGKYGDAEAKYRQALEENPASEMAAFNLASALLRQDTVAMKKAAQQQQQQQQPDSTQNKQLEEATDILKNLADNATHPFIASRAAYDLGNISYKAEQYDQAIDCYKVALRKDPDYEDARYNLRMAQLKKKNQNKDNKDKQNQDKDKDKDKDKNKNKDQQKQNQNQQNKDQDKDKQNQQQQQKGDMSQQNMEQILRTMQNQENATQQRVNAKRAQQQQATRAATRNKW